MKSFLILLSIFALTSLQAGGSQVSPNKALLDDQIDPTDSLTIPLEESEVEDQMQIEYNQDYGK